MVSGDNPKNDGVLDKIHVALATSNKSSPRKIPLLASALIIILLLFVSVSYLGNTSDRTLEEKKNLCEEGLRQGKFSFWLNHMRDSHIVCTMFAEAYSEMGGDAYHPSTRSADVPKIIHQSWKSTDLEAEFRMWSSSWKKANPDHEYWFWTDDDNRDMVQEYYPEFLEAYDTMPANINRADFVRGLYMHKYGGVYADLDTWCLRPIDSLFTIGSGKAYVAEMSPDKQFNQNIPNAWFASAPGHPFWIFFSKCAVELLHNMFASGSSAQIEQITGPLLLKQAVDAWNDIHGDGDPTLEILDAGKVYVDDWHAETDQGVDPSFHENNAKLWEECNREELYKDEVEERCKAAFPDAVVLTFWSHSWGR
jgi:mannosyltransferase OCH1-like enzyme